MIDRAGVQVAEPLVRFIEDRALPGTGIDADRFWTGLGALTPKFNDLSGGTLHHRIDGRLDASACPQAPAFIPQKHAALVKAFDNVFSLDLFKLRAYASLSDAVQIPYVLVSHEISHIFQERRVLDGSSRSH